jgi:hypothetical protein
MSGRRIEGRKLPDTRKNCNRMYSLQHFPQRAQSITAEAVLLIKHRHASLQRKNCYVLIVTTESRAQLRQAAIAAAICYLRSVLGATVGNVLRAVLLLEHVHESQEYVL